MSPSKLGWHFQSVPGWASSVVNSEWVKIIDPPAGNPFPSQYVIGRVYVPDSESNELVMRGASGADQWMARCQSTYNRAPWVWAWEGPNEPPVASPAQRAALVAFTRRWVQLMHDANRKTVALCLSVGWPDIGAAPDLAGALADTDYWAVHEYSAPSMQSNATWYCLRYRRTVSELRGAGARIPPLLITECGIDGGVVSRPRTGWKTFASRSEYLSQLIWYDGELAEDDYVRSAVIFTSGPNWDWGDFDMDEPLSHDLASYIESKRGEQPPPPVTPPEAESPFELQRPLPDGIGWVTHWFGEPVNDTPETGIAGHNGLDYSAPAGSRVLAAHSGVCARGQDDGYGIYVRLTAADGSFSTLYAHLQDAAVTDGQRVSAGATIGHVGKTGKSSSPQLHFGWKVAGVRNPAYANWLDPYLGRKLNGDA